MARPIDYVPREPTAQELIQEAQAEHADAGLAGVELLGVLHRHGVLNTASKLVRGGDKLIEKTVHVMEGDDATNVLRNASELVRLLSAIDPEEIGQLGRALTAGVQEGSRRVARGEGVGLGELMGLLRDRDVQLALGALFGTLKGFGRALRDARGETDMGEGQRRPGEDRR